MPLYYTDFFQKVNNYGVKSKKILFLANIRQIIVLLPAIVLHTYP